MHDPPVGATLQVPDAWVVQATQPAAGQAAAACWAVA
jgi:hypothetical protein